MMLKMLSYTAGGGGWGVSRPWANMKPLDSTRVALWSRTEKKSLKVGLDAFTLLIMLSLITHPKEHIRVGVNEISSPFPLSLHTFMIIIS